MQDPIGPVQAKAAQPKEQTNKRARR